VLVVNGDARALPLRDDVADAVITSPPYLTRIDYAVGTAPELSFLGFDTDERFRAIRSAIMGSTCITGGDYSTSERWGPTCLAALEAVRAHKSKASASYYFKTHVQYFSDAERFMAECLRVLKPGAFAALVVQDSWYKDVLIPLAAIYAEMAVCLGAEGAAIEHSVHVRSHIGLVNTRARRYKKGAIHEHIVLIRKAPAR
jgi:tRNA G10  N-methylase Trm11